MNGTIIGTTSNQYIDAKIEWSSTLNAAENTSTVSATLYYKRNNTGYTTSGTLNCTLTIGNTLSSSQDYVKITNAGWVPVVSHTATVAHNADGSGSVRIYATGYIGNSNALTSTNCGETVNLTYNQRGISFTKAPNFTDMDNPTIWYNNQAGSAAASLEVRLANLDWHTVSTTSSQYTFNLTEAERNILRKNTPGKSREIKFYIRRAMSGNIIDNIDYTVIFSVVNAEPTITGAVEDTNAATLALTGDKNKLVKYYSNAKVTYTTAAKKYATIASQKITNGGKTLTAAGTFTKVEDGSFVFSVTDSRGYTTSNTVSKTMVDYVKLTCDIGRKLPTAEGNFDFTVSGNYFNGSFGAVSNTLEVYYRYKTSGGAYSSWAAMTVNKSSNTYTATAQLTGLNYQTEYIFQAYAVDKLTTTYSIEKTIQTVPIFDWSDLDFKFNVPVEFAKGFTATPKILWSGASLMAAEPKITLTEKVENQMSGIVLVFSAYSAAEGAAQDDNFNSFFVPKAFINENSGYGNTFIMASSKFSNIATKYLYIKNDEITGHADNQSSGTSNGITYTNNAYVLRYVIGV